MSGIHLVRLEHDQQNEWESQVDGVTFEDAVIIKRLVMISMKLGEGGASHELINEARKLNEEFIESNLEHLMTLTFGARVHVCETHDISPEVGHG